MVVGYGSIGARHARVLREDGLDVGIVSRSGAVEGSVATIEGGLERFSPDYVVVASPTADHLGALATLAGLGFAGRVLVEKPLLAQPTPLPPHGFKRLGVGYNLRFHPLVARLRETLVGRRVLAVSIHCGQYLPDWRPGADYRATSSASVAQGGGVLRDLSHELDLAAHLFGPWAELTAAGGRIGPLAIETDDAWGILMRLASGAIATVGVDYWHRPARRSIVVETVEGSLTADFIAGTFTQNDQAESVTAERDATYRAMHRAMLGDAPSPLCTAAEGLAVVDTIAAIERAADDRVWISA